MQIILMRHGEAVPFAPSGQDRPLTPKGRKEVIKTAHLLKAAEITFSSILCSPRLRAIETAELVKAYIATECSIEIIRGITPDDTYDVALREIESKAEGCPLIVFHQPILTQIIGWLTEGSVYTDIKPHALTATAYVLELINFSRNSARLTSFYQP